ncbi:hypothetical protein BH11BAC5_BH11BAC5_36720 [soil metagenome]
MPRLAYLEALNFKSGDWISGNTLPTFATDLEEMVCKHKISFYRMLPHTAGFFLTKPD